MTDESTAFLPLWMFLSAVLGFVIGDLCGDLYRHRKCLEQANDELRGRLEEVSGTNPEIKLLRSIIKDTHKQISTVTKALQKRPL